MLLTPHIVRTHELTADDLAPIYIGTQQNIGLGGPPPLIAPPPDDPARGRPARCATPPAGARRTSWRRASSAGCGRSGCADRHAARCRLELRPCLRRSAPATETAIVPAAAGRYAAVTAPPTDRNRTAARSERAGTPATPGAATAAASRADDRDAAGDGVPRRGGPYTVPVSINNASRVSTLTITMTYNPQVLRVRNVQEGTFMRQGGVDRDIHAAHRRRRRPRRHRGRQPRRAAGASGSGCSRRCCSMRSGRAVADPGQRRREHAGRGADSAAVQSGDGDGAIKAC